MNKRWIGTQYEEIAVSYLKEAHYEIVEQNFRCRMGEIDIIAREGDCLVFIEVKFRKDTRKGTALEAVSLTKQKIICKVAQYYLMIHSASGDLPCRFDVIGITGDEITLVKNAFEYIR